MSVYTTEVRFICEASIPLLEQGDYKDIDTAIEAGRKKIFTFNYDLFDPLYKPVIESKFLRHFYTREIGFETVALWKLKLRDKWEMKLPYYNKLWESELLKFNPFYDVDYTVYNTGDRFTDSVSDNTGEKTNLNEVSNKRDNKISSSSLNENRRKEDMINKFSDTPQGGLDGVIETDWLTTATQDDNTITDKSKNTNASNQIEKETRNDNLQENTTMNIVSNIHDIDDYQKHVIGKMSASSYAKLLTEFRKSFLNIDEMFINEMNDLFMLIY